MTIISDKKVKIRKARRCSGCFRKFEIGAIMQRQTNDNDGIAHFYTCDTCTKLMEMQYGMDESEMSFPEGFVSEGLEKGQTPEQLLESLLHSNQPKG